MDIWLIGTEETTQVRPASIHGMLWLQTHFEDAHWEALAASEVILPNIDAMALARDAEKAGIRMSRLSALSLMGRL